MPKRTEAYVDTAAFVSFLDRSDTYHALFRRLFADPPPLVTTPLVIAEGHGWFLKRFDRGRGVQFLSFIESLNPLEVVAIGSPDVGAASRVIREFPDQDLTLVDALGLHLMRHRRVKACWSTDFHLSLTGVPLIIHA